MKLQGKVVNVSEANEYGDIIRITVDIPKMKIPREPETGGVQINEAYEKKWKEWEAKCKEAMIQHQNIRMLGLRPITIEAVDEVVIL